MTTYPNEIEKAVLEYAKVAETWFRARFLQPEAFEQRLRDGLRFNGSTDGKLEANKINLTRKPALFSFELFRAMISGGESYKPLLISIAWHRLLDAGLMLDSIPDIPGNGTPIVSHQISERALGEHLNDGTFLNLFAQPSRLPVTYSHAVASIDVMKNGDVHRGTGFVVEFEHAQYFVTCKHNVDPADGIEIQSIFSAAAKPIEIGELRISNRFDIAVARLAARIEGLPFTLSQQVDIFDEVFTLGYPLVPRAEPLLLGHRGEMNGHANLYIDKVPVIIISNLVSPGSSGGPVLVRNGRCVGMTINWLEGERHQEGEFQRMRFSAALPASVLEQELRALAELQSS